ncbi:unnamed protein product, partial [Laminaria digitata]
EKRRARQDAYRHVLDLQVADDKERRKLDAQKIREVEERHELKSATYNPWGKPGCGAPLRQADGALVTNVKAYYRAKLQGLVAQDLSPNEISDGEQPFGFILSAEGSPPRLFADTSTADGAGNAGGGGTTRRRPTQKSVSLSPPRNRYRFDRLPPEEQKDLDRRLKDRRELEAALICQVEEKRRRREREVAAKRKEDEADRVGVLKALAEDRAAFRGRARNKNLRAGEATTTPHQPRDFGSRVPASESSLVDESGSRSKVAWQLKPESCCGTQPALDRFSSFEDRGCISRSTGGGGRGGGRGGGEGGGGGGGVRTTGRSAVGGAGDEGSSRIMIILRKLEDHSKMLEKLASEMATVKGNRDTYRAQVSWGSGVLDAGLSGGSLPARDGNLVSTSSLSPLFRTFQHDEDQLDR